jgi:hypothetical protein
VAISLGTVGDELAAQIVSALPAMVTDFSALSALVVYWSKRVSENYVPMAIGFRAQSVRNPAARVPLPDAFALPQGARWIAGIISESDVGSDTVGET